MVVPGSMIEDYVPVGGASAVDGSTSMRHCLSVDSLREWRSCEPIDNGTPSTSAPHWDSDDEDDSGPKPCDLYGKFTWKIEHFSELNKRELRSNAFEVGGYKWYILIYPQGCDACNHLSLFLCVANHDKLLPGWSHFALFTITVVNKDPKKNKYNDTLHRFWKKEHDWGWKKFMELNKVVDGFVDDDILTIKAQVQVIREKAHRPFRCLDIQYRRELIRVYLSAVEQTCARFVEERKKQLQTWIDDKAQWSSFHSFWLGIDPNTRRLMSRDKTDVILKIAVKHFFIEKEVASTLVMDSLYTGLRVLESRSKLKKLRANLLEKEGSPAPFIFIEDDMFVLADDVFLLLERSALELAHLALPSKEEKGLPSHTKDCYSGDEFSGDSVLRDERRLTELGHRTLEIFIFAHIFSSRIEIAYKEAVALKIQEELIREEEEAEQAENEKREKRAKKKQARQRRNNRKGKDRGKDEKSVGTMTEKHALQDSLSDDRIMEDFSEHGLRVNEKSDLRREDGSDVSDPGDDGAEALQPDAEDRDTSPLSWDTDTSETHPAAEAISNCLVEKKSSSFVDDSSSTCSTDSVPSVVVNGPYKGYSSSNAKNKRNSSDRGKKQQNKDMRHNSTSNTDRILYVSGSCNATGPEPEGNLHSSVDQIQSLELLPIKKEEVDMMLGTKVTVKDQIDEEIPSNSKSTTTESVYSSANLNRKPFLVKQSTEGHMTATTKIEWVPTPEVTSTTPIQSEKSVRLLVKSPQNLSISKSEDLKHTSQAMTSATHQASSMSRPSSAPVIPCPKPTVPLVSLSHTLPLLTRTLSSASRFDSEPSFSAQTFEPQSYRNAIMGIRTAIGTSTSGFTPRSSPNSSIQSTAFAQPSSSSSSSSSHPSQAAARKDQSSFNHGIIFGSRRPDVLHNPHQRTDQFHSHVNDNTRIGNNYGSVISLRQSQGVMPDEFPHLDIINDLLDEDHRMVGRATFDGYHHHDDFHSMNQQHAFQGDLVTTDIDYLNASCQVDLPDYYYEELPQMVYDSFVPFHGISDMQPLPLDFSVYGNDMDALLQSHWPIDGADLSVLNFGNAMDVNGYPYQLPDYSTCGLGGYNMMYQPANGL